MSQSEDTLAARYALGVSDLDEMVAAEARYDADKSFKTKVDFWTGIFDALQPGGPSLKPSTDVWDRIEAQITADEQFARGRLPQISDWLWEATGPGVLRKLLQGEATGFASALYRLAPGARVVIQGPSRVKECLIIDGDLALDGVALSERADAIVELGIGVLSSRLGALVFLRGDLMDLR